MSDSEWNEKGATFSDKSARNEYGITQEEIIEAINKGILQYRSNHIHGNPYFRLLRREVEDFVISKYGKDYLKKNKLKHELVQINKQLRKMKKEISLLEQRKSELLKIIA